MTNREFSKTPFFKMYCEAMNKKPTKRQASKYFNIHKKGYLDDSILQLDFEEITVHE